MATQRTVKLIATLKDNMSPGLKNLAVGTAAVTAAMIAMVAQAFKSAKALSDYGASIYDTASATGLLAEDVQALGYAFDQTGGSSSSMSGAIRGLNTFMRTAATGSAEYINVLNQLGLEYDSLRAMNPADAFLALTDAIGGLDTAMEKNIAATTVFGGRYAQQVTGALAQAGGSLRNLTDAFNESEMGLSGEQIDALKSYSDTLTDLEYSNKKLTAELLNDFLPTMQGIIEVFSGGATKVGDLADKFGGFGTIVRDLTILIGTFTAVKIVDMAANGQLTLSTGLLAAAKVKLAAAAGAAKAAMAGPAGLAAAAAYTGVKLVELTKAIVDANSAADANEEATMRMSNAQIAAGDIINAVLLTQREGLVLTDSVIESYLATLNRLDDGSAEVATAIEFLNTQLGAEQRALVDQEVLLSQAADAAGGLDYWTRNLSASAREAKVATLDFAIAQLMLQETMTAGPTVIAAQIAELERFKNQLVALSEEPGTSLSPFSSGDPAADAEVFDRYRTEFARLMSDTSKMAGISDNEMAQSFSDRMSDQTEAMAEYYDFIEAEELTRAEAAAKAQASMESFSASMIGAAIAGQEAWEQFWTSFRNQVIATLAVKGFMAVLNFALPGVGTAIGGALNWLGFAGGTPSIPNTGKSSYGAAGGMVVPGNPASQSDGVPMMAQAGEVVLSRSKVDALANQGGNNYYVTYAPQALMNTASRAEQAQAVPVLKRLLEKGNLR